MHANRPRITCFTTSSGAGEPTGHEGDHAPQVHGFVVGGEAFVVAGAAAVAGDPGQGPLDDPAAGQDGEGVQVIGSFDDLHGQFEVGGGPGLQFPGVAAVGPGQADAAASAVQVE